MIKKHVTLIVVLVLVIAGIAWLTASRVDKNVSLVLEKTASDILKTGVTLSGLSIDMKANTATVDGLVVANLSGYAGKHIITIQSIESVLDHSSMQENLLIIESMRIDSTEIFYESDRPGVSNLHLLLENIKNASMEPGSASTNPGLKTIIKKLEIGAGVINGNSVKTPEKVRRVSVSPVEVLNIGQVQGGLSTEEVARVVAGELVQNILRTVAHSRLDIAIKPADSKWLDAVKKDLQPDS